MEDINVIIVISLGLLRNEPQGSFLLELLSKNFLLQFQYFSCEFIPAYWQIFLLEGLCRANKFLL